jgi:hypothetical protein
MGASVQLPTSLIATVDAVINDNNGTPVQVIESASPWSVDITFSVNAGGIFAGWAHFDLFVQQIGGTSGGRIGDTAVDFPGDGTVFGTINVAADHPLLKLGDIAPGTPLPHPLADSGVYHLVLVMTHHNQPGLTGLATEATAVLDLGIMRVS